jgi:hypothetical protein
MGHMSDELLRKWIDNWTETGKVLEALRRRELEALTDDDVRKIVDQLFSGPMGTDLPPKAESGLVEQQRWFARMRARG